jgi:hypothetical protein
MSTHPRRFLDLNLYIRNSGYHESAWKVSPADPASVLGLEHFVERFPEPGTSRLEHRDHG